MNAQRVEGAQHEPKFGAGPSSLNPDQPLATDANSPGEFGLTKTELLATVTYDRA